MSKLRSVLALVAVATLALMGCGGDDDTATDTTAADDAGGTVEPDDSDAAPPDLPDVGEFEAPEGAAATVGDTEVPTETVEAVYGDVAASPEIAEQLASEQGALVAGSLRAQILSELVVFEILSQGADEDFGVTVSGEDLDEELAAMEEAAGGAEALDTQLETSTGLNREAFREVQLPLIVLLQQLEPEFGDLSSDPEAEDPSQLTEGQMALQEWGASQFADAEVSVATEYGTWNAEAAQVVPAGMPTTPSIEE